MLLTKQWILVLLVGVFFSLFFSLGTAQASLRQTQFKQSTESSGIAYQYQWSFKQQSFNLSFLLSRTQLSQLPPSSPKFSNRALNREIEIALKRYAASIANTGAKVIVRKLPNTISYSVTAANQSLVDQIMYDLEKEAQNAEHTYFSKNYLQTFTDHLQGEYVQNDYAKYIAHSYPHLRPVVDALRALQQNPKDIREFVSLALAWIQSIPYDNLQNRMRSNGAGFLSPVDLLRRNMGDCDSKSTLFAALLRAHSPSIELYMVMLSDHALLAASLPAKSQELSIRIANRQMVLLEPTGPAAYAIGEVGKDTQRALNSQQFTVLKL